MIQVWVCSCILSLFRCFLYNFFVHFGDQKINLHPAGWDYEPKARVSIAGSADLCFIVSEGVESLQTKLVQLGVEIIEGPVVRTGATGPLRSIYIRDPDGNLIELSNRAE